MEVLSELFIFIDFCKVIFSFAMTSTNSDDYMVLLFSGRIPT